MAIREKALSDQIKTVKNGMVSVLWVLTNFKLKAKSPNCKQKAKELYKNSNKTKNADFATDS